MQINLTQNRVQAMAKTLRRELGASADHRAMLDALAKSFGYKSFGALKASLPKDPEAAEAQTTGAQTGDNQAAESPAAHGDRSASEIFAEGQARRQEDPLWQDFANRLAEGISPERKRRPAIARIGYAVLPDGYAVQAYDADNQPIDELGIREGNASGDGMTRLQPGAPTAKSPEWLFVHARRDALAMAERHGVPLDRVFEDDDLENEAIDPEDPDAGIDGDGEGPELNTPRRVEITFAPKPLAIGVTVIIDAQDPADFRAQVRAAETGLVDTLNNAFDRIGDLRLPHAGDYGLYLQLETPGEIVDVYED